DPQRRAIDAVLHDEAAPRPLHVERTRELGTVAHERDDRDAASMPFLLALAAVDLDPDVRGARLLVEIGVEDDRVPAPARLVATESPGEARRRIEPALEVEAMATRSAHEMERSLVHSGERDVERKERPRASERPALVRA